MCPPGIRSVKPLFAMRNYNSFRHGHTILDNRLYALGSNYHGQCGQGTTSDWIYEPVEVKNLKNLRIKQISAGYDHCLIKCSKINSK